MPLYIEILKHNLVVQYIGKIGLSMPNLVVMISKDILSLSLILKTAWNFRTNQPKLNKISSKYYNAKNLDSNTM
jgi:hypothetical protein